MSSLVDAIVLQDNFPSSVAFEDDQHTPRPAMGGSSRPGLPTSEADHMDMDEDDNVVGSRGGARGNARPRADLSQVPKVSDEAGDQILNAFTNFLEKSAAPPTYCPLKHF